MVNFMVKIMVRFLPMKTTIDFAGRLVIPRQIRQAANLRPGQPLEITFRDGRVEIEPAARRVKRVGKGRIKVAVPLERSEPLTADQVRQTQERLRARTRKD